jgi:hypothetical protein
MSEKTEKPDAVERSVTWDQIFTLLTVIRRGTGLGIPFKGVKEVIGAIFPAKAGENDIDPIQLLLNKLEMSGLITSNLQQIGTGGTCDRFYRPAEDVYVKVFGPPPKN